MPGLLITEWGPATWNFLHAVAHTQPKHLDDDERDRIRRFLYDAAHLLPCKLCGRHFSQFLDDQASDVALSTRANIVRLLNNAHNDVNVRHNKRTVSLPEHYRIYSRGNTGSRHALVVPVVGLCTVGALIHVMRRGQKNPSYQ